MLNIDRKKSLVITEIKNIISQELSCGKGCTLHCKRIKQNVAANLILTNGWKIEWQKDEVHRAYEKEENARTYISCGSGGNRTDAARHRALK